MCFIKNMRSVNHCYTHYVNFKAEDENQLTDEEAKEILMILNDSDIDLRRGDLISTHAEHGYRNQEISIYDGVNIVNLCYDYDDYGCVPEQFKVIQEFPINYWKDDWKISDVRKRGIDHNNIVWFDHNIVKDQCIKNITHKIVNDGKYGAITQFTYNDKIYYIVLDEDGEDAYEEFLENNTAVTIQLLKNKLLEYLNLHCIVFESESQVYSNQENNILFISVFGRI